MRRSTSDFKKYLEQLGTPSLLQHLHHTVDLPSSTPNGEDWVQGSILLGWVARRKKTICIYIFCSSKKLLLNPGNFVLLCSFDCHIVRISCHNSYEWDTHMEKKTIALNMHFSSVYTAWSYSRSSRLLFFLKTFSLQHKLPPHWGCNSNYSMLGQTALWNAVWILKITWLQQEFTNENTATTDNTLFFLFAQFYQPSSYLLGHSTNELL